MKNKATNKSINNKAYGVICGVSAYVLWGLLPLYWKLLKTVPAFEILSHRIVWSFVFVTFLVLISRKVDKLKGALKDRKCMTYILICSLLVSMNWFIYIWAVNSNHIVAASMGYFITPFVSVLLGMFVLKEKLNGMQYLALSVACIGVLIKIIVYGEFPWISLMLAITFGFYGLFKKRVPVESTIGLTIETLMVTPIALSFLIFTGANGNGSFLDKPFTTLLLALTGIATATPLLLFSETAKNVKLTTIGFLQYISPTISLFLGVYIYKEGFTQADFISFGLIWVALGIYSISIIKMSRRQAS
jgi:chloramphenicol-sensitive protein RarD